MADYVDETTGEIVAPGYDTTQLQDFGDFVNAGLQELGKRDGSTWALGDIAAAFVVRVQEGQPKDRDPDAPTLVDLATAWKTSKQNVSRWRDNALFWNVAGLRRSLSWFDLHVIRQYVAWELQGEKDIEVKIERGVELLEEVEALALCGVALEIWLKEKRRAINNALPLPPGKYQVIYADPPWEYGNTVEDYFVEQRDHYRTMTVAEIAAMPMKGIATDNAVLFLWVTSPILREAFEVVEAWGFEYKSSFIWNKDAHNMGHYNSVRHELLLVCIRGSFKPVEANKHNSVVTIKRSDEHSEKPAYFREMIEQMYPDTARVELFAREHAATWEGFGNELALP